MHVIAVYTDTHQQKLYAHSLWSSDNNYAIIGEIQIK